MRRTSSMGLSFPPFTRAVKQLLIANGLIFLAVTLLAYSPAARNDGSRFTSAWCLRWWSSRLDLAVGDVRFLA